MNQAKKVTKKQMKEDNARLLARCTLAPIEVVEQNKAIESYQTARIYAKYKRYSVVVRADVDVDFEYYSKSYGYPKVDTYNRRVCFYKSNLLFFEFKVPKFGRGYMKEALSAFNQYVEKQKQEKLCSSNSQLAY